MTDKPKPWFRLKLSDEAMRKMTREEYEASEHHARLCAKIIRDSMVINEDAITDLMVYGASPVIMAFPDVKRVDLKEFYND